jgi:hypothetical protein
VKPLLIVCCLAFMSARTAVAGPIPFLVYSSFAYYPPGPIGPLPGPDSSGQVITGASLPPGYLGYALSFVPSESFDIYFMDFGLYHVGGTNSAVVELRDDFSGIPGQTLLGSWDTAAVTAGLLGLPVSGHVEAGQRYWITVLPGAGDTNLNWVFNNQGVTGDIRATHSGSTYPDVCHNCTLPAFDILGNPVPEPSTLLLSIAGFVTLLHKARRRNLC